MPTYYNLAQKELTTMEQETADRLNEIADELSELTTEIIALTADDRYVYAYVCGHLSSAQTGVMGDGIVETLRKYITEEMNPTEVFPGRP